MSLHYSIETEDVLINFNFIILDTGFAYAEDVANIGILNHQILDNFVDLKFNN